WTNSPTSYSYQWQQCNSEGNSCTAISGATNQTYVPVAADVGHKLRVRSEERRVGRECCPATATATGAVTPPPPVNTEPPTIYDTAQQRETMTEPHRTWTNSPTSYSYQWQQCNSEGNSCTAISGATNQTYVPVAGDVGHTLRVQETASTAGGSSAPATSAATAAVVPPVPTNTAPPTISGTAQQGQTLTEAHGTWTNSPTSFAYQWQQCDSEGNGCVAIPGATKQTYVPVAADVGHTLRVQETASNAGGSSAPASSVATAAVVPLPPSNETPPTITGTAQQGQTLTEHNGAWSNSPTSYSYQWERCEALGNSCLPISGATKQTYVLVAADVSHTIKVQEAASNAGGPGAPATSEATAIVFPEGGAPSDETPPTITGEARQGRTLTEHGGSWTHEPTSFSYQWLQCDSSGSSCTPISGASKSTYEPVAED